MYGSCMTSPMDLKTRIEEALPLRSVIETFKKLCRPKFYASKEIAPQVASICQPNMRPHQIVNIILG